MTVIPRLNLNHDEKILKRGHHIYFLSYVYSRVGDDIVNKYVVVGSQSAFYKIV